jgi:hypothetical protein
LLIEICHQLNHFFANVANMIEDFNPLFTICADFFGGAVIVTILNCA